MEYLDIVNEAGEPTGETISRDAAHRDGVRHRTAHVWVVRRRDGKTEILLQKRSMEKESFPGLYDTSSAGHIPAGQEPAASALRELSEELGIEAAPEDLAYAGMFRIRYDDVFHGRPFRDNEVTRVYVYTRPVDTGRLARQAGEVDEARWFGLDEVWDEVAGRKDRRRFCMSLEGLNTLRRFLKENRGSAP